MNTNTKLIILIPRPFC